MGVIAALHLLVLQVAPAKKLPLRVKVRPAQLPRQALQQLAQQLQPHNSHVQHLLVTGLGPLL